MRNSGQIRFAISGLVFFLLSSSFALNEVRADTLNVAVASNFALALRELANPFQAETGHTLKISVASTGKLYAQILHGAPFDVFLSANEWHANKLIDLARAESDYSLIYALGKLVFISNLVPERECRDVLHSSQLKYLAIANPAIAPYGAAAQQVMENLKVWDELQTKLVLGENIAQAFQFVASTSAEAGFVAKSLMISGKGMQPACVWNVPDDLYQPVSQKMVLLKRSSNQSAAIAFWRFMQTPQAAVIIRDNGYDVL